jgi:hypothetical protein
MSIQKAEQVDRGNVELFEQDKYLVVRQLLRKPLRELALSYALRKATRGAPGLNDPQVPGTPSYYGDPFMEMLLQFFRPEMERLTGKQLYPTYSYFRIYKHGDILEAHLDRPSCEFGLSLTLGYEAANPWPFVVEVHNKPKPINLLPGDAVLFKGMELKHWRDRFDGGKHVSVFLHYVDRNGAFSDWKNDKRNSLGAKAHRLLACTGGEALKAFNAASSMLGKT